MKVFYWVFFNFLALLAYGQSSQYSPSDKVHLPNTEVRILQAQANGVAYKLYISLPADYHKTVDEYPVLYLLDADYSFAMAKNITDHLSQEDDLKPVILVGLAYDQNEEYQVNKIRDYTPTKSAELDYSPILQPVNTGGAKVFKEFLEKELMPFIAEHYRVNDHKAIAGHSFGALFCSWAMLQTPDLFDGYIIVSPTLWYDDYMLYRMEDYLPMRMDQNTKVYLTVGDHDRSHHSNLRTDLDGFYGVLKNKRVSRLHIKHSVAKGQTHHSVLPGGLSNGIRFVFDGT